MGIPIPDYPSGIGFIVLGINNKGTVLAATTSYAGVTALYWNGTISTLVKGKGLFTIGASHNDAEEICGGVDDSAALWGSPSASPVTLPSPTPSGAGFSIFSFDRANWINAQGDMCGWTTGGDAAFWNSSGCTILSVATNPTIPQYAWGDNRAHAITDAGDIYGVSSRLPVVWKPDGTVSPLPLPFAPSEGRCVAANNGGMAIGEVGLNWPPYAAFFPYLWSQAGNYFLPIPLHVRATAQDINDLGQVVGTLSGMLSGDHAVGWFGNSMIYLESLIDPALGWRLVSATGINNHGEICGVGVRNGRADGFVMRPAPRLHDLEVPPEVFFAILGQVRSDGPGVVIGPEGKPIRVPPWNPSMFNLSEEAGSLIAAMLNVQSVIETLDKPSA